MAIKEIQDIHNIYSGIISEVNFVLLSAGANYNYFECLFSSLPEYIERKNYSLYSIKPLYRSLLIRNEQFSKNLLKEYEDDKMDQICFLHSWDHTHKKIILFELKDAEIYDEDQFISITENNKELFERAIKVMAYRD